jgi:redox-sensing transcriptional repressor
MSSERLTVGVAARLSRYLQVLTQARKLGRSSISSQEIAEYTRVNATQIRRDLSGFGRFGKRGVGYNLDALIAEIRTILRTAGQHHIAVVGAGNLGRAIVSSNLFADHGFNVVAVVDSDPAKVGDSIADLTVEPASDLDRICRERAVIVGILAVPDDAAQEAADALIAAEVHILFNYSGALLTVPPHVKEHTTSPTVELLHALYFHLT